MNITHILKRQITAKFLTAVTIVSLLVSALPAAFFVAEAASLGVTLNQLSLTTEQNVQVNVIATALSDDSIFTAGTFVSVTDNGAGGAIFSGTIGGECNSITADADSQFAINENKGVCYSNSTPGVYSLTFQLLSGLGGAPIGEPISATVSVVAATPVACTPQFNVAGPTAIQNANSGDFFNTVNGALADCDTEDGDTIELLGDISTDTQINIARPITLDGNDNTISPTFTKVDNSNNSVIGILGTTDVTIKDLMIDGAGGTNLHGINVYLSTGVSINDTTISNPKRTAVVVNGSNVAVNNLTTSGSQWHAINAAPGSGVTDPTVLTINGVSVHGEALPIPHIYTDDTSKNVTVNDINSQYEVVFDGPNPQNLSVNARSLRLKTFVTPPTEPPVGGDTVKPITYILNPVDGLVTNSDFDITIRSTDDKALEKMVINLKDENGVQLVSCLNETVSGTDQTRTCTVDVSALGEGSYQFKANAHDVTGNVSNTIFQTFTVESNDDVKPVTTISEPINGLFTTTDFRITIRSTDDVQLKKMVINLKKGDGSHLSTCLNETVSGTDQTRTCTVDVSALGEGSYQFKANAQDTAGNISNTIIQTFTIGAIRAPKEPIVEIPHLLEGYKYEDVDGDGVKDITESGLAGWTIYAKNVLTEDVISTTTNATGYYYFLVSPGDWEISEASAENWKQVAITQNEVSTRATEAPLTCSFEIVLQNYNPPKPPIVNRLNLRYEVTDNWPLPFDQNEYNCDFYNQRIETNPEEPTIDMCANLTGNQLAIPSGYQKIGESNECTLIPVVITPETRRSSSGGGTRTRLPLVTPQALVLGAATSNLQCGMYLQDYTRMGIENDSWEITKLQWFLTGQGYFVPATGIFDTVTDKAVRDFQMKYQADVLTPWFSAGIVTHEDPTGWMYQLTRWKINNIVCPGSEALPTLN